MLKKLLSMTILGVTLISNSVLACPCENIPSHVTRELISKGLMTNEDTGNEIHNPNNYNVLMDYSNGKTLLIPDYFKHVYKDDNDPLETYIPMLYTFEFSEEYGGEKQELAPVCIERIYRYYYFDDNNNKVYFDYGEDLDIYRINGCDYISIREVE